MPACKSQKVAENNEKIQAAINDMQNDEDLSIREAAKWHRVNRITRGRRLKGGKSIAEAIQQYQHLSIPQEKALVKWITCMAATGNPPKHEFIREVAEHLRLYRIAQDEQITNTVSGCAIGES